MSEEHGFHCEGMGTRQQNYEPISVLTSHMSFYMLRPWPSRLSFNLLFICFLIHPARKLSINN